MKKKEDKETRYYIDLALRTRKILNWDYDQRNKLVQNLENPDHQRIFITKGQYNKLEPAGRVPTRHSYITSKALPRVSTRPTET
jgi:hypothetical protein